MSENPLAPRSNRENGSTPIAAARPIETKQIDAMRVLRQFWWLLMLSAFIGLCVGVGLHFLFLKTMPSYSTTAYMLVDSPLGDAFGSSQEAGVIDKGALEEIEAYMENQIIHLRSVDLLQNAIEHPKIKTTGWYSSFDTPSGRLKAMLSKLRPLRMRNSTIIAVEFTGPNVEDPPLILDTVIDLFLSRYQRGLESEGGRLRSMMDEQRRGREAKIDNLRTEMVQYREEHDLETLEGEKTGFAVQHNEISEALAKKKIDLESMRRYYGKLLKDQQENRIVPSPQDLARARSTPSVQEREQRLSSLREGREMMSKRFGPKHRSVMQMEDQMLVTEQEMQREIDSTLRRMQSVQAEVASDSIEVQVQEIDGLEEKLAEVHNQMMDLISKIDQYRVMEEELERENLRLTDIHEFLDQEAIKRRRPDVNLMSVIQRATDAELAFPNLPLLGGGMMMIFLGGATGLIFLREKMDQRIKTPADVKTLPSVELLGVLPEADEDPSGPSQVEGIVVTDPSGLMAESFRQVRSSLISRMDRGGYKTLLACGAQAQCGVSALVDNIALSMALNGRKILVLDTNFRRPAQHELFGCAVAPGLVELLNGEAQLDDVVFRRENPQLDVIPAGAQEHGSPELLEGPPMRNLLIELEKRYDFVLIDGSPASIASDSMLVAKHVDAMILIVRAMSDKRGLVTRMLLSMQDQRCDLLGVILNGVRSSLGGYFRKNYREFYRYRQTQGRKKKRRKATEPVAVASDT